MKRAMSLVSLQWFAPGAWVHISPSMAGFRSGPEMPDSTKYPEHPPVASNCFTNRDKFRNTLRVADNLTRRGCSGKT